MAKITKSLQDTIKKHPLISEVHFDGSGHHYFNVFELPDSKDDRKKPKLYGKGAFSHRKMIPGSHLWGTSGDSGYSEIISKGDQSTLIVETISREDILSAEVKPEGDSLVAKVANLSKEDREALRAMLAADDAE